MEVLIWQLPPFGLSLDWKSQNLNWMNFHDPTRDETVQTRANPTIGAPAYWTDQLMTITNFAYPPNIAAANFTSQVEHQT
mgnify:CR=1 FL=1